MIELLPEVYRDPERFRPRRVDDSGMAEADAWITGDHMLDEGTTDGRVAALQRALVDSRHDPGPTDGVFGPRTVDAVRAFQRQRSLTVDGIIGPQTMSALTSPFLHRFLTGLEVMLGPVEDTLDNLTAYASVATAPTAFVDWLGWVVGAQLIEEWDRPRRLRAVDGALALHHSRGTVPGVAAVVALQLGLAAEDVVVTDGGETSWDMDPDTELQTSRHPTVTITLAEGTSALADHELARLRNALADSLPVGFGAELLVPGLGTTTVVPLAAGPEEAAR